MNTQRYRPTSMKVVVLIVFAMALCAPICDQADHHGASASHAYLCTVDVPQVFHLVILMNSLFLAVLTGVLVLPTRTFSLLKPPRFVPISLTAR